MLILINKMQIKVQLSAIQSAKLHFGGVGNSSGVKKESRNYAKRISRCYRQVSQDSKNKNR